MMMMMQSGSCSIFFDCIFWGTHDQSLTNPSRIYSQTTAHSDTLKNAIGSILFMDDENTLRKVVQLMLKRLGYNVTTAAHGQQALSLYESYAKSGTPFDIVILDINIKNGMDGIETIEKLLEIDPKVKAIGASGSVTPEILERLLDIGFVFVLAKPFQMQQLQHAIENALVAK